MEKDVVKYFQINARFYEELVFNKFKEFLNSVNLHYVSIYNAMGQFWDVFINVEGEVMKKAVYIAIELFVEAERYAKGDELYERKW